MRQRLLLLDYWSHAFHPIHRHLRARRALMLSMFHWEPEWCYGHRLCTAIAPFWSLNRTLNSTNALLALNGRYAFDSFDCISPISYCKSLNFGTGMWFCSNFAYFTLQYIWKWWMTDSLLCLFFLLNHDHFERNSKFVFSTLTRRCIIIMERGDRHYRNKQTAGKCMKAIMAISVL